jgi:hypothetical protein
MNMIKLRLNIYVKKSVIGYIVGWAPEFFSCLGYIVGWKPFS